MAADRAAMVGLKTVGIVAAVLAVVVALVVGGLIVVLNVVFPSGPGCEEWNGKKDLERAVSAIQANTGASRAGDTYYDCDSSRQPRRIDLAYETERDQTEALFDRLDYCHVKTTPHTWDCTPRGRRVDVWVYLDGVAVTLTA